MFASPVPDSASAVTDATYSVDISVNDANRIQLEVLTKAESAYLPTHLRCVKIYGDKLLLGGSFGYLAVGTVCRSLACNDGSDNQVGRWTHVCACVRMCAHVCAGALFCLCAAVCVCVCARRMLSPSPSPSPLPSPPLASAQVLYLTPFAGHSCAPQPFSPDRSERLSQVRS